MKKVICMLLVAILTLSLGVTAFASENEGSNDQVDNKPAIKFDLIQSVSCDRKFSIMVSGENIAGLESCDLTFYYDPNIVEFINVRRAESSAASAVVGDSYEYGEIFCSYMYFGVLNTNEDDILVIDFIILETGIFELDCEISSWAGTEKPDSGVFSKDVSANAPHTNTTFFEDELEALPDSCIHQGYTKGVYCNGCKSWVSGHKQTMKIVHIDNNSDRVCDYCEAYIGIPDIPETDDEPTDNESNESGNIRGLNSIIEIFMKIINFIKQLLGL